MSARGKKLSATAIAEISGRIADQFFAADKAALDARAAAFDARIINKLNDPKMIALYQQLPDYFDLSPFQGTVYLNTTYPEMMKVKQQRYRVVVRIDDKSADPHASYFAYSLNTVDTQVWHPREQSIVIRDVPDLADEGAALKAAAMEHSQKYHNLLDELQRNMQRAGTSARLMDKWPEAAPIVEAYYYKAEFVETPLEDILSKYANALPAPPTPSIQG